jgi:putative transposase
VTDFLQDHPQGVIIAWDEMSLYFQATTTRVWAPRGQTPVVRVSPQRDHVHFYGALNLRSGHELSLSVCEQSSETTVEFLDHLLSCYPNQAVLVLWDRAPWHRGAKVRALLDATPRLETMFFPPACPQLNPQEHVWSQVRADVSHNHTFKDFSRLKAAFEHALSNTLFQFDWLETYAPAILFAV